VFNFHGVCKNRSADIDTEFKSRVELLFRRKNPGRFETGGIVDYELRAYLPWFTANQIECFYAKAKYLLFKKTTDGHRIPEKQRAFLAEKYTAENGVHRIDALFDCMSRAFAGLKKVQKY
jgi:hypothetical protein